MKTYTKILLTTASTLGMVGTSSAAVIFDASTTNTTVVTNNGTPTGVSGSPGALTYTGATNAFNASGFASTDNINALNGTNLVSTDIVTIQLTVTDISGGAIRANGINFGLGNSVAFGALDSGDNLIGLEAVNNGNDVLSFLNGTTTDTTFSSTNAEILNGFSLTLVADVNGWEYTLNSVGDTSPLTFNGAFTGTEFVDSFGTGHFYYTAQKFNQATALTSSITEASIDVTSVPEPSSTALLGLGGLALILRRRK